MSVKSLFKFQAPPNTRMQPTAFGARDRRYFGTSLCGAPAAAADAQSVRTVKMKIAGMQSTSGRSHVAPEKEQP